MDIFKTFPPTRQDGISVKQYSRQLKEEGHGNILSFQYYRILPKRKPCSNPAKSDIFPHKTNYRKGIGSTEPRT